MRNVTKMSYTAHGPLIVYLLIRYVINVTMCKYQFYSLFYRATVERVDHMTK